jgi:hypothetical protein
LHPDQQEAYEESVARGQIDVVNAYRAQAGLEALSTKSTPFRLIGTATAVVAIAALVSFWQQRGDSTRRLGEDDTPDSSTEHKPIGFFGIILMCVILMIFLVGVVTRHNVAPSLVRLVFDMRGEGGDAADLPKTDGDKVPSLREYVTANPRNGAAYPETELHIQSQYTPRSTTARGANSPALVVVEVFDEGKKRSSIIPCLLFLRVFYHLH